MANYKAVLFDLGNTLLYFNGSWPQVFAQSDLEVLNFLKTSGLDIDEMVFLQEFRNRINEYHKRREIEFIEITIAYLLRDLLKDLGYPNTSEETIRTALQKMYQVSQSHWLIEKDCLDTLDKLKSRDYKIGIISNASDDADVQKLVGDSQIKEYVDFALSSAACGIRKPDPRIFSIALSYWDFTNEEVIMVGDTLNADILGAKNSNIKSVWIKRRANIPNNLDSDEKLMPDETIETLSELPDLLDKLTN
ncbi:MAG: HAD family hydrolase [Chloroflexi bacterium]|jgi:HAD superfamily hydrolase (TIGR01549 family)|nr:HAD family hydrolase [Chloroflexota bacterium]MBT3671268.1 HAD family hydrolase [Chloroflexota bacterium]MBT4004340.1 HAD family hydrolase [Chloroflexota bacterium]MBT4304273.1 HAD family hydrolase [Chloroflexota bacterium]MBT4534292.1 HAD family hydrolase [Chloroflexota bacterium]